jgi:hypothetical protein
MVCATDPQGQVPGTCTALATLSNQAASVVSTGHTHLRNEMKLKCNEMKFVCPEA